MYITKVIFSHVKYNTYRGYSFIFFFAIYLYEIYSTERNENAKSPMNYTFFYFTR